MYGPVAIPSLQTRFLNLTTNNGADEIDISKICYFTFFE